MRAIWAVALLVVYLAATGLLLVFAHARVSVRHIVLHLTLLGGMAAATWLRGLPRWLRLWAPLIALPFLYAELPSLIRAVGHSRLFDTTVMGWERAVFGVQPSLVWASKWPSPILGELLHATYLSYYGIIVSVPVGLYLGKRDSEFAEATFALMLTFVACFLCYIAFPVAGPRYLWGSAASAGAGPFRLASVWLLEVGSSRGTAFPSSHVAVAVTQSILALRYFGRRGLVVPLLATGLALGAIYGGFHYAVDVLAGAVFGAIVTAAALVTARRGASRLDQAKASAPT